MCRFYSICFCLFSFLLDYTFCTRWTLFTFIYSITFIEQIARNWQKHNYHDVYHGGQCLVTYFTSLKSDFLISIDNYCLIHSHNVEWKFSVDRFGYWELPEHILHHFPININYVVGVLFSQFNFTVCKAMFIKNILYYCSQHAMAALTSLLLPASYFVLFSNSRQLLCFWLDKL